MKGRELAKQWNGAIFMTERKDQCGVNYTLDVLEDKWQPGIIYWLGFRPFTIDELHRLLP